MHLSIRTKLIGAFLLVAALMTGASVYTLYGINQTNHLLHDIIEKDQQRIETLQRIELLTNDTLLDTYALVQGGQLPEHLHDTNPTEHLTAAQAELTELIATFERLDGQKAAAQAFHNIKTDSMALIQEAIALSGQPAGSTGTGAIASLDALGQKLDEAIEEMLAAEEQSIKAENDETIAAIAQLNTLAIAAIIGTLAIALLLGALTASSFSRRIMRMKEGADSIRAGNLSKIIKDTTRDELGAVAQSFNEMSHSLRDSYGRLAFEKERDETLLQSMGEGMIALDAKGNVVLINNVAMAMLEFGDRQALIGKNFGTLTTLYGQEGKPLSQELLPSAVTLQNGQIINEVFGFQTKDQRKMLINIACSPIKLDGKISGAILILRDVTKEKEVDRMKTEFISLASHQLRTPLSAIKWFSEMLLNGDAGALSDEQKDFTKNIADSTDRMVDLVNSLLNISRIESGRIIIDPHPTDLKDLITGIVNDLKAKTEERQQTLIISVHPDMPKINLDSRMIGQVYLNLLTNAIKYTPKKGEISVFVSKKGNDVVSQVTDNGYGIPKDQQGRIFQKFFRAENVSKVETDGTGLGLYLIKAIVESSGGKIWFESEEGKGTSFWFTIPLSGMKPKSGEVSLDV